MKKLIVIAALAAFNYASSQSAANNYAANTKTPERNSMVSFTNADASVAQINSKTLRHFAKDYHHATMAEWYNLPKNETMCRFYENGLLNRAFYNSNGFFEISVKEYEEASMPKDIRRIVKSTYFDYDIMYVQEIYMPGETIAYVIHLQDTKMIKILKVQDADISVMDEFERQELN